jgi:hypothetical protein
MALRLCAILLKVHSNYEKNIRQITTKGHSTKYLTVTLPIWQGNQNKENLRTDIVKRNVGRHDE